jgi:hypothetical protein
MRPFSRDANNSQAQITNFSGVLLNLPPNSKPQCGSSSNVSSCPFWNWVGANSQRANHLVLSNSPLVNKFITFSTKKSQRSFITLHLEKGVPNLHFSWSPKSVATCSLLCQFPTSSVAWKKGTGCCNLQILIFQHFLVLQSWERHVWDELCCW